MVAVRQTTETRLLSRNGARDDGSVILKPLQIFLMIHVLRLRNILMSRTDVSQVSEADKSAVVGKGKVFIGVKWQARPALISCLCSIKHDEKEIFLPPPPAAG